LLEPNKNSDGAYNLCDLADAVYGELYGKRSVESAE
jgi:hypothetical protein